MKIVQITAGAGGRLCGSCLHDNALVRALRQRNRDAILVPAYVPTTSDEEILSSFEFKILLRLLDFTISFFHLTNSSVKYFLCLLHMYFSLPLGV